MKTYLFEGIVTALSSITHNGGERNGTITQLRREKFVQPSGKPVAVPVISGNSIRGILRDKGMFDMLRKIGYGVDSDNGKVTGLPLQAFYFLFSGGALVSTGSGSLDVGYFRKMKEIIPLIGLFGGAAGNAIMPGKLKIGKLLPVCKETAHLLPERFRPENPQTIWEYCQAEMYTRRDDAKNDRLIPMLQGSKAIAAAGQESLFVSVIGKEEKVAAPQQMMYHTETLAAGTTFYWKIVAEDITDVEFEAFLTTMVEFSKQPNIGGKSATGHGEISIKMEKWIEIDSRVNLQGTELDMVLGQKYEKHLKDNKDKIRELLNTFA